MNWAELVRECHFVDNTGFLRALEDCKTPIFLRPKRFGKSVVCSMLAHYYDIACKERFAELFGKTAIGRDPTELHNAFLVLTFDFSTITVGTVAEIEYNFTENVRGAVEVFAARYGAFADFSKAVRAKTAAAMIDGLRGVIRARGLPPLYVIIDEYDNFTNQLVTSGRDADYDAVCCRSNATGQPSDSFFKSFFKSFKAGLSDGSVGRTYFTGVLPITVDDLSSGFNVGTIVNLDKDKLGMVGFTRQQIVCYVDEIFAEHELDLALKTKVLGDLKRLYDGYRFLPGSEPLYNSTICNWYLRMLVISREIPTTVTDANLRTDVGWFRRLAGSTENALAKLRGYVERGETEKADMDGLAAKFGRTRFFSDEFYPYALYYLGLLTFADEGTLTIPNLSVRNMFVDYYNELSEFKNTDEARRHFIDAALELARGEGSWRDLFEQYWQHYVKARIPAQAFDKMNENFFRTTFTSRCLDSLTKYYSFETEYNTPEGRCDFLAVPRPDVHKPALLIEFKYFTMSQARRRATAERKAAEAARAAGKRPPRPKPDAETRRQALAYVKAATAKPDWGDVPLMAVVVEIHSRTGYRWLPVKRI